MADNPKLPAIAEPRRAEPPIGVEFLRNDNDGIDETSGRPTNTNKIITFLLLSILFNVRVRREFLFLLIDNPDSIDNFSRLSFLSKSKSKNNFSNFRREKRNSFSSSSKSKSKIIFRIFEEKREISLLPFLAGNSGGYRDARKAGKLGYVG